MGLCNIYGYLKSKTVKLSDSYQVRIKLNQDDFTKPGEKDGKNKYAISIAPPENNEIELFECTSVTLPAYKPKTDIFEYGNNSKTFIYMDPKSLDDLEIEVIERYTYDARVEHNRLYIDQLVNLFLSKLFDNDKFVYKLNDYIPELTVYVFSNIFNTVYMKYVFQELKLTDYSKFNLDYSSTDIAKWTLKFSYRSFFVLTGEELKYKNEMAPEYTNILNNDEAESTKLSDTPTNIEKDGLTKSPIQHGSNPMMTPLKGPEDGGMTPMNDLMADLTSKFTPEQATQQDNISLEPGEISKEEPAPPSRFLKNQKMP